ncbi:MAG: hypothetical protein J1E03_03635 [Acetatifactor sp.]|nr:hypothetical protein [Acetatifactor sp.]
MDMILKTTNLLKSFKEPHYGFLNGRDGKISKKSRKIMIVLLFAFGVCFSLAGCSLKEKIEEYSSDKERCYLNIENVTQFS